MEPLADVLATALAAFEEMLRESVRRHGQLAPLPDGEPPRPPPPQPSDLRWSVDDDSRLVAALPEQLQACAWCRGSGVRVVPSEHYPPPHTQAIDCSACDPWRRAVERVNAARIPGAPHLFDAPTDWSRVSVEAGRGCTVEGAAGLRTALYDAARTIGDAVRSAPQAVLLYGPTGTGKTRLLAHAARYVALRGRSVLWWDGRAMLAELRGPYGQTDGRLMERLCAPTLLVVDELDPHTDRARDDWTQLYHARDGAGRPTWVATNLAGDALDRGLTPSVLSRAHRGVVARLAGADARRGAS